MFRSFYAVTKDRKGGIHQYRLTAGEGVPRGEEIVDLRVAGQFSLADILSYGDTQTMYAVASPREDSTKMPRRKIALKRAPKE